MAHPAVRDKGPAAPGPAGTVHSPVAAEWVAEVRKSV